MKLIYVSKVTGKESEVDIDDKYAKRVLEQNPERYKLPKGVELTDVPEAPETPVNEEAPKLSSHSALMRKRVDELEKQIFELTGQIVTGLNKAELADVVIKAEKGEYKKPEEDKDE